MMEMANSLASSKALSKADKYIINIMISPFAPHLGEEIWNSILNETDSIFNANWPDYDNELIVDDDFKIAVQVNGKLRGSLLISKNSTKDQIFSMSKDIENVSRHLDGGELVKEIYVPGKIVNFVIK